MRHHMSISRPAAFKSSLTLHRILLALILEVDNQTEGLEMHLARISRMVWRWNCWDTLRAQ